MNLRGSVNWLWVMSLIYLTQSLSSAKPLNCSFRVFTSVISILADNAFLLNYVKRLITEMSWASYFRACYFSTWALKTRGFWDCLDALSNTCSRLSCRCTLQARDTLVHLYRINIAAPNCGTVQIHFSEVHFALREKRGREKKGWRVQVRQKIEKTQTSSLLGHFTKQVPFYSSCVCFKITLMMNSWCQLL